MWISRRLPTDGMRHGGQSASAGLGSRPAQKAAGTTHGDPERCSCTPRRRSTAPSCGRPVSRVAAVRQLLPTGRSDLVDPVGDVLTELEAAAPSTGGRPWVMANMVTSIDGSYSLEGRSGGLSSDADRHLFHALRAGTDVVMVAAGTARAEQYRRPGTPTEHAERRRAAGRAEPPRLCLVTRSGQLPDDLPLLSGPGPTPLLAHPDDVDTGALPGGVEPIAVDDGRGGVDLGALLDRLGADGARTVLCEGGPSLLGQLHALDLIDELFVSVAPSLVGGEHVGLLGSTGEHAVRLSLHRVLTDDDFLFCTYRRTGAGS